MSIKYVKWPSKNSVNRKLTKPEWENLDSHMRGIVERELKETNTQESIFVLGEMMAELHKQKLKPRNVKKVAKIEDQYEYLLQIYDALFERIL